MCGEGVGVACDWCHRRRALSLGVRAGVILISCGLKPRDERPQQRPKAGEVPGSAERAVGVSAALGCGRLWAWGAGGAGC